MRVLDMLSLRVFSLIALFLVLPCGEAEGVANCEITKGCPDFPWPPQCNFWSIGGNSSPGDNGLLEAVRGSSAQSRRNVDPNNTATDDRVRQWAFLHFLNITMRRSDTGRPHFEDYYAPASVLFQKQPPFWGADDPAPHYQPSVLKDIKVCGTDEDVPKNPMILTRHTQGHDPYELLQSADQIRELQNREQADSHGVLVDQKGSPVYYEALVNRNFYTQVKERGLHTKEGFYKADLSKALQSGASILMTAWRVLGEKEEKERYLTARGHIPSSVTTDGGDICFKEVTVALVGMNIAAQVGNMGRSQVWAAFEHEDNVPDCALTPDSTKSWSFHDGETDCNTPGQCNSFIPGEVSEPTIACRKYPSGDGLVGSHNNQCLDSLNESMHKLKKQNGIPWKFYKGIGVLWVNPTAPDQRVTHQNGSLLLSSSVLETFRQHRNCVSCHDLRPRGECLPDRESHLYQNNIFSLVCRGRNRLDRGLDSN